MQENRNRPVRPAVEPDAGSARAGRPAGREARSRLLVTAERLFAQRGIDAVSVREILDEAGQRNKNAAQYYFGGRDGLISALANSRSEVLNARRMALLDDIEADGRQGDVRALCHALVQPLTETLDEPGNHFIGFLARYQLDHSRQLLSRSVDPTVVESYLRAAALLRTATGLPKQAFAIRFSLAVDMCLLGLAGRQNQEEAGVDRIAPRAAYVDNLIDALCGIFTSRSAG